MAKDAKGHGSEKRGGTFDRLNEARKREGYAPMPESRRGIHNFLDYMAGDGPMPDVMAAAKLAAGNPKAAKAPIHPDAAGRSDSSSTPWPKGTRLVKGTTLTPEEHASVFPGIKVSKSNTYSPGRKYPKGYVPKK